MRVGHGASAGAFHTLALSQTATHRIFTIFRLPRFLGWRFDHFLHFPGQPCRGVSRFFALSQIFGQTLFTLSQMLGQTLSCFSHFPDRGADAFHIFRTFRTPRVQAFHITPDPWAGAFYTFHSFQGPVEDAFAFPTLPHFPRTLGTGQARFAFANICKPILPPSHILAAQRHDFQAPLKSAWE